MTLRPLKAFIVVSLFLSSSISFAFPYGHAGIHAGKTNKTNVFGAYLASLEKTGYGLYGEVYSNWGDSPSSDKKDLNSNVFADSPVDNSEYIFALHGGVTKRLFNRFSGYAGAGLFYIKEYQELYDASMTRSDSGFYYFESRDDLEVSFTAGLMYSTNSINIKIGGDTGTKNASIGIGLNL